MKAPVKIFLIVTSFIVVLFLVGNVTGILSLYRCTTNANAPTLTKGESLVCSNLLKPERFKFVRYIQKTKDYGKQIHIMRVCGLSGDTVLIREGVLYINGQQSDSLLSLAHDYLITRNDLANVEKYCLNVDPLKYQLGDTLNLSFADNDVQQYSIPGRRVIQHRHDDMIFDIYHQNWTQDYFGPYIVPEGSYFVLGDNRHDAIDSRYYGPVLETDIICTIL